MSIARRLRLARRLFKRGLSLDMSADSSTLLVAFGGLAQEVGMPPFEFFGATGGLPVKRLFVRDPRQAWYHLGIIGHGRSIEAVGDSLGRLIARHDVERLVVTGNSMGGYAALIFGTLLRADVALCFAPQTVVDLDVLGEMNDHNWDRRLGELRAANALEERWLDLGEALPRVANGHTRYEVYFDEGYRVDRLHAERIGGVPGTRLYRFGRGGHHIAKALRESGALEMILRRALLAGTPQDAPADVARADGARAGR